MAIEFKHDAHKACYEKVAGLLREIFGEFMRARDDAPVFLLKIGSAVAQALVLSWGDDDAVVNTRAYVVCGAERTPELLEYLLHENSTMRFGAFGLDPDGDIIFELAIVASTCDKEEVKSSLLAVVNTADGYDDKIVERWGGRKALER